MDDVKWVFSSKKVLLDGKYILIFKKWTCERGGMVLKASKSICDGRIECCICWKNWDAKKKKEFFHFFASHNANFKHNYGIQAYSPYEPVDAPKMKYKFKNLFPLLQTFHGVSRWPNDEFKMGASIFRQLWGQIRIHFWTLYDVEGFKSYKIWASKWMIWNEFFSSKKVWMDGKYKF